MKKVLIAFGTRPEAIKMAPVVNAFRACEQVETTVCVTAQHREMLDQVLDVFKISTDYDLNIMKDAQTLTSLTASTLSAMSEVVEREAPDIVLVHGDTTTTLTCGLAAFYNKVAIGHVEAGLRTGDFSAPWPEELNRRFVDLFANLLWAPTEGAAENLRNEGVADSQIFVTGNTVIDSLIAALHLIDTDVEFRTLFAKTYPFFHDNRRVILVTGHRRENFDGGLEAVCRAVKRLGARADVRVVWPVHPNPIVMGTVKEEIGDCQNIHLIRPVDYLTFVNFMRNCSFLITDSGGIQEEAPFLRKPVLVTRMRTERPEAVAVGAAKLVGPQEEAIVNAGEVLLDDPAAYEKMRQGPTVYGRGEASAKIVSTTLEYLGT